MSTVPPFKGFAELVPAVETKRDYGLPSGDLAEQFLARANKLFSGELKGFPGLEGTLKLVSTDRGLELAGSNFPVLATMNLVDLDGLGIQLCDERDLARVYNDEVQRVAQGKQGFFQNRFWFDIALIRNPQASQTDLKPWEEELDREITSICGDKDLVSVPYRAIVPVVLSRDNAPFGQLVGYSFRINPAMKSVVKSVEVTPCEAQEGYDFVRLNETTAFPVKGRGRHFYGISANRRFSGLCMGRGLSASRYEYPLGSDEAGRVVVKSAEGTAQK